MQELRQSTEVKVRIGSAVDATDGVTPETGLILGAADQAELLKHNGAATVDISASTFAAVTAVDGWYDLTLTAGNTDTLGQITAVIQDSSLMAPIFRDFMVVTANYWDSKYSTDVRHADVTQIGGVAQSATDLKDFADTGYDPVNHKTQSDLIYIHGTALTETDGQLAAAFKKLFDVATPLLVASDVMVGTDAAALAADAITDIITVTPAIPGAIDLANTISYRISLMLTNALGDLPSSAEITPGTITISRKPIGSTSWTNIISGVACLEANGIIYYQEVFDSGSGYAAGDSIRIIFFSQKVTIGGVDHEIAGGGGLWFYTYIREAMVGTNSAALATGVDVTSIHGSALTETVGGYLAAGFTKLFDVATPVLVASDVMRGTNSVPTNPLLTNDARLDNLDATISSRNATTPLNAAAVKAEAVAALSDIKLDHLLNIAVDTNWATTVHLNSVIGHMADVGTAATFDRTTDALEAIRVRGDSAWVTSGVGAINDILNIQTLIPFSIDLANTATVRIGLGLTNMVDDLPTTAEITPGTITIDRKAIGGTSWVNKVNAAACLEAAGLIYYDEVFDTGTGYVAGDSIRVTFKSQKITVDANDFEITGADGWVFQTHIREAMVGTDSAALATTALSNATWTDAKAVHLDANISSRNATTPPTVIAVREEMDSNSTRLDANVSTRSSHTAANVWAVTTRALTDKAGFALSTAGIKAIWDQLTSALTTVGSAGKLLVDNINATISSRNATTPPTVIAVREEMDSNSTRLDANVSTRSSHTAANVWAVTTRALTDKAGFALSTAGIKAIWDQLTSALTTVGSAGKLLVDNINATISSRNATTPPTVAAIRSEMEGVGTKLTAVKDKTDNLPSGMAKNVAVPKFEVFMVLDSDHITAATGKTVTGVISKDGGAFAALTNSITEVSNGTYIIASGLTQDERNADVSTLIFSADDCDDLVITIISS